MFSSSSKIFTKKRVWILWIFCSDCQNFKIYPTIPLLVSGRLCLCPDEQKHWKIWVWEIWSGWLQMVGLYSESPIQLLFPFFLSFSQETVFFFFSFLHTCRRLCLYPNGNVKSNGKGYISLYLAIADIKKLPPGWEINVNFKLFVFNHKHEQYLTVQGRIIWRPSLQFSFYKLGYLGQLIWNSTNLMLLKLSLLFQYS